MAKKKVQLFVSYARANKELTSRFLDNFRQHVAPSKSYNYSFWSDSDILVGENWHEEIQEALEHCILGLILISPALLGSQYITEHELPKFVGSHAKPLIPVMLQPVDFERYDLKGLKKNQIFRLDRPKFRSPKSYYECSGKQRNQFVLDLFGQVEERLDKLFRRKTR